MAGNGGGASASDRFLPAPRRPHRWGGCWGALSCFGSQKRTTRIVPSSRSTDGNATANRGNGPHQAGMANQATTLTPSLLAPPSSPASFSNSALPSTVQSPNCFLSVSANSPGGPSSRMFATGPYAHETQLVSPPVFSTYTTEPSTAPLTPPSELAHLTTPSSPDVPFAQYLSSSYDLKGSGKDNGLPFVSTRYTSSGSDLRVTYPLYPESPASSLISPMSITPRTGRSSPIPKPDIPSQWDVASGNNSPYSRYRSWKLFGMGGSTSHDLMISPESSFYPAAPAQFHLDHAQQANSSCTPCGGRPSVSGEANAHANGGRHSKACKQDVEEVEAYRASFGFSADEIITAPNYVEPSDGAEISFSIPTFASNNKASAEQYPVNHTNVSRSSSRNSRSSKLSSYQDSDWADLKLPFLKRDNSRSNDNHHTLIDDALLNKMREVKVSKSFRSGMSSSDAEIDYRRSRSTRNARTPFLA